MQIKVLVMAVVRPRKFWGARLFLRQMRLDTRSAACRHRNAAICAGPVIRSSLEMLELRFKDLANVLAPEYLQELIKRGRCIGTEFEALMTEQGEVDVKENDPDRRRDHVGYVANLKVWQEFAGQLLQVKQRLDTLNLECDGTEVIAEKAADALSQQRSLVAALATEHEAYTAQGYFPVAEEFLSRVLSRRLNAIGVLLKTGLYRQALAAVERIDSERQALLDTVETTPVLRNDLTGRLVASSNRALELSALLTDAQVKLERARHKYAEPNWAHAQALLRRVAVTISESWREISKEIMQKLSMETQDWVDAKRLLDELETSANATHTDLEEVDKRLEELDRIAASHEGLIASLTAAVMADRGVIEGLVGSNDRVLRVFDDLILSIAKAESHIKGKPNYVRFKTALDHVNQLRLALLGEIKGRCGETDVTTSR